MGVRWLRSGGTATSLVVLALGAALTLVGCGDDAGAGADAGQDVAVDGGDTALDTGSDTGGEVDAPDSDVGGVDVPVDGSDDGGGTDVGQDVEVDADQDVEVDADQDVEVDADQDVEVDADQDVEVDADQDVEVDIEDDAGQDIEDDAGQDIEDDAGQDIEDDADLDGVDDTGADALDDVGEDAAEDADAGEDGGEGSEYDYELIACEPTGWPEVPAGEACAKVAGGAVVVLRGTILGAGSVWEGGEVVIDAQGKIACVGCDCSDDFDASATFLYCPNAVVSPGLINSHDHITFTQSYPGEWGTVRYNHRHEWRVGLNGKPEIKSLQNFYSQGETWGELRMIFSGVTSMISAGGEEGFTRNLDKPFLLEGLSKGFVELDTFPLGDSDGTMAASGCSAYEIDYGFSPADELAYHPHVAEGIDVFANNEFLCLSGENPNSVNWLADNVAHIHGIGLTAPDVALMAGTGTALIWSPRTNISLYGATASVILYDRLGALIGLGTDWVRSGSMNMLRELRCADEYNATHLGGHFSDKELFDMATLNNAMLAEFADVLGSIAPGKVADIAIFRGQPGQHYRAVLDADVADVALVLRGGIPQYGDDTLVANYPGVGAGDCELLDVCGISKRVCAKREVGMTLAQLTAAVSNGSYPTYPIFFCDEPPLEPSCVPYRKGEYDGIPTAEDMDGDGVPNGADNCPSVFNAPRPLDASFQPDIDGDDVGDACDPCPFDADTEACTSIDPLDIDGDGVQNETDNCPKAGNPDQADADGDDKGDVCDPCPSDPNPGQAGCPTPIYDIRTGVVPVGTAVILTEVVVTAAKDQGYFVQTPTTSPNYDGVEFSALYVYNAPNPTKPQVGDLVTVSGTVGSFFGQIQLGNAKTTILAKNQPLPPPVVVPPSDVKTGGAAAAAYENVLIRVEDVIVEAVQPPTPESQPTKEFQVSGGLLVNDFFYAITPLPVVGDGFSSITGVLRYDFSNHKLEPRSAADVKAGPPGIIGLSGEGAYVYADEVGASTPPIVLTLSSPTPVELFVPITSSDPSVLDVLGGGVHFAIGQQATEVVLESYSVDEPTTVFLTATLGPTQLVREVLVIPVGALPSAIVLAPEESSVGVGQVFEMTATIDIPAPPGGVDVLLVIDGPSGTIGPDEISIAPGEFSVTFQVTAPPAAGFIEITALMGEATAYALVQVVDISLVGLILVEVFYDATGADDGLEFVKLYNGTPGAIDLSTYSIGYGGTDYTTGKAQLSGVVASGACFVIGGPQSTAANGNPTIDQPFNFTDDIQNSGATADGVALFAVPAASIAKTTVPIDAVVYGTTNSNNLLGPAGTPKAVDVGDAPAGQSLLRTAVNAWIISPVVNAAACPVIAP